MRMNFNEISVVNVFCVAVSGAALLYSYLTRKKAKKEAEERDEAFDSRINNVLGRFNKTVKDLEQSEYEVELTADVVEQITRDETRKEAQKMVAPMVAAIKADANATIDKHARATVEDILDSTKAKTESRIEERVDAIDIRDRVNTVMTNVENRLEKKLERDMDKFKEKCESDYQQLADSKKKLLDIYSDNASEGYALYKNINEKISSK